MIYLQGFGVITDSHEGICKMVDTIEDVAPRFMNWLKMFLAASTRGQQAVFVLKIRNRILTTKSRSVELLAGAPTPPQLPEGRT